MTYSFRVALALVLLFTSLSAYSQRSREYIRTQIQKQGNCRNVAITKTNGDLMLYGRNGWAATGCPTGLTRALDELNDDGEYIDDVQLTESGSWLILYGDNGMQWNNVPYSLERKMREYNNRGDVITSVTFNDAGWWIIISEEYISASSSKLQSWLADGTERYGQLWAACVTDDAVVAVYESGYKFEGNVPEGLKTALRNTTLDVYRLKIAGSSWFFADKKGAYQYHM